MKLADKLTEGVTCKSRSPRSRYDTSFSCVCTRAQAALAVLCRGSQHGLVSILSLNWLNFCLLAFGSVSPRYLERNWGSKQLSWAIVTAWGSSKQPDSPMSWGLAKGTGTRGESGICSLLHGSGWAGLARMQGKFSLESLMSREREEGCHCPRKRVVNRVSCSACWRIFPSKSFVTFSHGRYA